MPFNLSTFKGNLVGEGARSTLFDVQITAPSFLGIASNRLTFTCRAAQLPGRTFGVIEVPYFGRKIKIAGDATFADWTITVINDESYATRKQFEIWMAGMNSNVSNIRLDPNYKLGDAVVKQYSKSGDTIHEYRLRNAFPSDLGAIDVAWDANDSLQEYTVTMQYDWWDAIGTTPEA
jgi:hypothetical protein